MKKPWRMPANACRRSTGSACQGNHGGATYPVATDPAFRGRPCILVVDVPIQVGPEVFHLVAVLDYQCGRGNRFHNELGVAVVVMSLFHLFFPRPV